MTIRMTQPIMAPHFGDVIALNRTIFTHARAQSFSLYKRFESEKNRKSFKTLNFRTKKKIMSAEVATNNNPNRLDGESKMKYEKLKKQLETPIETRINVNFCLLVYWLPGSL